MLWLWVDIFMQQIYIKNMIDYSIGCKVPYVYIEAIKCGQKWRRFK